MGFYRVNNID